MDTYLKDKVKTQAIVLQQLFDMGDLPVTFEQFHPGPFLEPSCSLKELNPHGPSTLLSSPKGVL
jgi:hypothetical protein